MTSSTDDTAAEEPRAQARERLLQAAEQLFARHGYAGTSLRAVMALAEVDTGAIHYHFRNKLGLLKALFEQRVMAVNGQRHALLQRLEQQSPQPAVEDILRAFIAPALRAAHSEGEADFNRVTALCSVDPDQAVREVVFAAYDEAAKRFAALLRQALPQLSQHDFQWRLECMYGAMMYIRSDNGRVSRMLGGGHRADPVEHVIDELVAFTAAGFRAAGFRAAGTRAAGTRAAQ